jgi:nitric oxide reductase subunit B
MKLKINSTGSWFFLIAIGSLFIGLIFGVLGCFQYLFPTFLKDNFSFQKMRPLHTYLCINWIFSAATGAIYYYLPKVSGKNLYSSLLAKLHVALQLIILIIVVTGFCFGVFGGREYFEFPPYIAWLIIIAWVFFMINFFATLKPTFHNSPVYIWSWSTGLVFFLITFLEAQLWQLSFFNNNIIRDVTVQWKAMGSMVGSWNMLVYGTAMYAMEKISGNTTINKSKTAFFFFFLGLTNMMYNWGHHTYIVPSSQLVKTVSYVISMTELLFLANIIYSFRRTYLKTTPHLHPLSFRILTYAEIWVLANLVLSITISVPAINYFTHGTHITVAHAMGSTIGINTLLLLASLTIIADDIKPGGLHARPLRRSLIFFNISLFVFWASLVGMGLVKIASVHNKKGFYEIMSTLSPYFKVFTASGAVVVIALLFILVPLFKIFYSYGLRKLPED